MEQLQRVSAVNLRLLRAVLLVAGVVCGALLSLLEADSVSVRFSLAVPLLVHAAYGALAGWAVGALIAHLMGER